MAASSERSNDVAMQGKGVYSAHSDLQHDAMLQTIPLFERAAESVKSKSTADEKLFSIAEYGVGHGNNSLEPLEKILQLAEPKNAQLLLSDRPENDYNFLAATMTKWAGKVEKQSKSSIYISLIPKNFYHSVAPPQSVHIGFSLSCLQHLSRAPREIDEQLQDIPDSRQKLQVQASMDLSQFLRLRAEEIVSGGFLILSMVSIPRSVRPEYHGLRQSVYAAMQGMLQEELIPQSVLAAFQVPMYSRTADDVWKPLKEMTDAWTTHEVIEAEVMHPAVAQLEAKKRSGDPLEASTWYTDVVVDWLFAVIAGYFLKALKEGLPPDHTEADEERLLAELVRRGKEVYLKDHRDEQVYVGYIHVLLERV